jgi:hypothetical protein
MTFSIRKDSGGAILNSVAVGFLIFLLWTPFSFAYNQLLSHLTTPMLSALGPSGMTGVVAMEDWKVVLNSGTASVVAQFPKADFQAFQFSICILFVLALLVPKMAWEEKGKVFGLGMCGVMLYHAFVVLNKIFFVCSTQLGEYSVLTYMDIQRNIFGALDSFNSDIGVYAVPVLIWMVFVYPFFRAQQKNAPSPA